MRCLGKQPRRHDSRIPALARYKRALALPPLPSEMTDGSGDA